MTPLITQIYEGYGYFSPGQFAQKQDFYAVFIEKTP